MYNINAVERAPRHTTATRPFLMPFRGHWINGIDYGDGDPLLLIMGLGGNVDMWKPLIEHLPGRRIIAFDAPGTGQSSLPMVAVTVPELADLAAAVLLHRSIRAADVLGYSYGGAVAQQMAKQHPQCVRKLILTATTCGVGTKPAADPRVAANLASPWRYYSPDYFKRTAAAVYGGLVGRDAGVRDRLARSRTKHPPHPYGYFLQLAGGSDWSSLQFLADITQHTLVLVGDDDPLVPVAAARQVADGIPLSEVHVMHGSGHMMLMDEPERAAAVISTFLNRSPLQ